MVALHMGLLLNGVQVDSRVMTQRAMQISGPRQPQAKSFLPRSALLRSGSRLGVTMGVPAGPTGAGSIQGRVGSRHLYQASSLPGIVCPGCSMSVISLQCCMNANGPSTHQGGQQGSEKF